MVYCLERSELISVCYFWNVLPSIQMWCKLSPKITYHCHQPSTFGNSLVACGLANLTDTFFCMIEVNFFNISGVILPTFCDRQLNWRHNFHQICRKYAFSHVKKNWSVSFILICFYFKTIEPASLDSCECMYVVKKVHDLKNEFFFMLYFSDLMYCSLAFIYIYT